MDIRRWAAGLAVTAVVAGGSAAGAGAAQADTPTTPAPASDHANSQICAKRIPAALARIEKVTARINGDATVRGSTAWLQDKADKARGAGYTALADLLAQRASDRPARLAELTTLTSQIEHVQATDCTG